MFMEKARTERRRPPKPVQIKIGINDGIYTQLLEGLKEGDEVIVDVNAPTTGQSATQNPFGGGRRGF